jgi:hypothetical protein
MMMMMAVVGCRRCRWSRFGSSYTELGALRMAWQQLRRALQVAVLCIFYM